MNEQIKVGDKVLAYIGRSDAVEGIVRNILNSATRGKICIITGNDGALHKCIMKDVIPVRDDPKTEPARLNLTREEFRVKFVDALNPNLYDVEDIKEYMSILFTGTEILERLEKILFDEK